MTKQLANFSFYDTILCDQIWMARNKARVDGNKSFTTDLSLQVLKSYIEHKEAWDDQQKKPAKEKGWKHPPKNWVKLNFDVVIREEKITIAVVTKNEKQKLLSTYRAVGSQQPFVG